MQHVAELEDVPPGLIGQRNPEFVFMSAQQDVFCWAGETDSLGRIGVKEARLSVRMANNSRAGSFIARILSRTEIFERARRVDAQP